MDPDPDKEASERVGRSLGKWRLEGVLGTGGMACVYSARTLDGERAAIKVLHKGLAGSDDLRRRFAQEGAAASRVGHPGVVDVMGSGEEPDGTCYLVLELLQGEPFGRLLRREDDVGVPRLLDVLDQVLDVLAAAHAKGIVHRDLKPDNLFVTEGGKIKVLDFGIARILEGASGGYQTSVGVTLGTVTYMSPEQALGKRDQVDGRSDLFSLGAMAFRLLARRNVHEAGTDADMLLAMATRAAPPLSSVAPGVPPALAAIVDVALAYSKDSRYPDARTMQADVRAVAAGQPPPFATKMLQRREMSTRLDLPAQISPSSARPSAGAPRSTPRSGDGAVSVSNVVTVRSPAPPDAATVRAGVAAVRPVQDAATASTERAGPASSLERAAPVSSPPHAARPSSLEQLPQSSAPVSGQAATVPQPVPPSVRAPASVPPSTGTAQARREASDPRTSAPTVEQAVYGAATVPMSARPDLLADGPTMQSTPPPTLAGTAQAAAAAAQGAPPSARKSRAKLYIAAAAVVTAGTAVGAYFLGAEQTHDGPSDAGSAKAAHPVPATPSVVGVPATAHAAPPTPTMHAAAPAPTAAATSAPTLTAPASSATRPGRRGRHGRHP